MQLYIYKDKNTAIIQDLTKDGYYELGTLPNAIGNILYVLEQEFPSDEYYSDSFNYIVNAINSGITGKRKVLNMWGFSVSASSVPKIYDIIGNSAQLSFDLKDIEDIRISYNVQTQYMPIDITDKSKGIKFTVKTFFDVIYGLLYFYAFEGLKLKKCEHCGLWFATPTYKIKYCTRHSPIHEYKHLLCSEAVQNIKQNCTRIRNRIETKARSTVDAQLKGGYSEFIIDFKSKADELRDVAYEFPTVDNLTKYWSFLKQTEKSKEWLNKKG